MSDVHQQLLDTEQALVSILDELLELKAASVQIDTAKEVSKTVIQIGEEINKNTIELVRGSEAYMRYLENSNLSEALEKIDTQNLRLIEISSLINDVVTKIDQGYIKSLILVNDRITALTNETMKIHSSLDIKSKEIEEFLQTSNEKNQSLENLVHEAMEKNEKYYEILNKNHLINRRILVVFSSVLLFLSIASFILILVKL